MPWVPKKDALRKYRELASYTVTLLAQRSGISARQLGKIESDQPPGSIYAGNLYALTSVLGCTKEDLATWVARLEPRAKPTAEIEKPKRKRNVSAPASPRNFDELVALERELRLQGGVEDWMTIDSEEFTILGAERIAECQTHFGAFDGQRFVAIGQIEQYKPLPFSMAKVLGVETGEGARFKLGRLIAYDVPVQVTVFTASAEATRKMIEFARENQQVTVIVRVQVARPKNQWKGFVNLEADAKPQPFAFVVEAVVS